jgi:hypothetical protein
MKMNVRLLRKIAKVIQEKPRQFKMTYWHNNDAVITDMRARGDWRSLEALYVLPKEKQKSCDTTHCIAGWAQVISKDRNCKWPAEQDARRLLELSKSQASRLFFANEWPYQFRGVKDDWKMSPAKAAARIEHFIKTGGKE